MNTRLGGYFSSANRFHRSTLCLYNPKLVTWFLGLILAKPQEICSVYPAKFRLRKRDDFVEVQTGCSVPSSPDCDITSGLDCSESLVLGC